MSNSKVSWPPILVEAIAIVFGILLAFAIDAAWEERQERKADVARLQGLVNELRSHEQLLGEAIDAHGVTVESGQDLLERLADGRVSSEPQKTTELIDVLLNFYRINAPFGSLETAMSSGTMARMSNVDLSSRLASWPTVIDDLLEEQNSGATISSISLYDHLSRTLSMEAVYSRRLSMPSGRGIRQLITDIEPINIPRFMSAADYDVLRHDEIFINKLLNLMMYAQSSQAEAALAHRKLSTLIDELANCLDSSSC